MVRIQKRPSEARSDRGRSAAAALFAAALLAACADGGPRAVVHLAEHVDDPVVALESAPGWDGGVGLSVELERDEGGGAHVLVGTVLAADAWEAVDGRGGWKAAEPLRRPAGWQARGGVRLAADGRTLVARSPASGEPGMRGLRPGEFRPDVQGLWLRLDEPPPAMEYTVSVEVDRDVGGRRRAELEGFSGDGWHLWSGVPREVVCDVPPRSTFDFFASASAFRPADVGESARLRVTLDGAVLVEESLVLEEGGAPLVHRALALPDGGRAGARLGFELSGPPSLGVVLAPRIRPGEPNRPGAPLRRRTRDDRPDLVLFLADTFRADNMATYGGDLALTPNLDALAARSLVFRRTWSPAPWTIPSQASMLAGHAPPRLQPDDAGSAIGPSMVTIAEHLAAAGYRTGAVTDGLFVSRTSGFHQGFELFDERLRSLEETHAAVDAFLDADDGRPVFLFVQTYRVHQPYHVSEATREAHGERLGIVGDFDEAATWHEGADPADHEATIARLEERTRRLESLYRGGVLDLDRWFAEFHASMVERGLLPDGVLVFTSDHGEAFGEHGMLWHVGGLWEELIRVPLFLHGSRIRPGEVELAGSLTDLPHTLCELAGVAPRPEWDGTSLISLDEDRTLLAFERGIAPTGDVAVIRGPHKLLAPADADRLEAGRPASAFDLERDPGETVDLSDSEAWPADLARDVAPETRRLIEIQARFLENLAETDPTNALPARAVQLEALGYADDGE